MDSTGRRPRGRPRRRPRGEPAPAPPPPPQDYPYVSTTALPAYAAVVSRPAGSNAAVSMHELDSLQRDLEALLVAASRRHDRLQAELRRFPVDLDVGGQDVDNPGMVEVKTGSDLAPLSEPGRLKGKAGSNLTTLSGSGRLMGKIAINADVQSEPGRQGLKGKTPGNIDTTSGPGRLNRKTAPVGTSDANSEPERIKGKATSMLVNFDAHFESDNLPGKTAGLPVSAPEGMKGKPTGSIAIMSSTGRLEGKTTLLPVEESGRQQWGSINESSVSGILERTTAPLSAKPKDVTMEDYVPAAKPAWLRRRLTSAKFDHDETSTEEATEATTTSVSTSAWELTEVLAGERDYAFGTSPMAADSAQFDMLTRDESNVMLQGEVLDHQIQNPEVPLSQSDTVQRVPVRSRRHAARRQTERVKKKRGRPPKNRTIAAAAQACKAKPARPKPKSHAMTPSMRKGMLYDYKTKFWRSVNTYCRDLHPRDLDILTELETTSGRATNGSGRSCHAMKPFGLVWAEQDMVEEKESAEGATSGKRKIVRTTTEATPDVLRIIRKGATACRNVEAPPEQEDPLYQRLLSSFSVASPPCDGRDAQIEESADLETRLRIRLCAVGVLKSDDIRTKKDDDEITARMKCVEHELEGAAALRTIALHNVRVAAECEISRVEARRKLLAVNGELERLYFVIQAGKRENGKKAIGKRDAEKARRLLEERKALIGALEERTAECESLRNGHLFRKQADLSSGLA